ncbi:unnamed protein product [Coregonus sp. 'balchen']|nr:unnamed protein product [Coregonus sp. 'balchen']
MPNKERTVGRFIILLSPDPFLRLAFAYATGDPKPRVSWNKKGKKVNSQRIETIEFDEGAGAVLRIQPLRAPRDENIYECVAENSEGEVNVNAKLSIIRGESLGGDE